MTVSGPSQTVDLRARTSDLQQDLQSLELFPALRSSGRAYLDSASTTQLPRPVLDAVQQVLTGPAASPGRGSYPWATAAAAHVEATRSLVARFVGAAGPDEIVFTSGATAASNAVAVAWGQATLVDGDEVLVSPSDHAATVLPWVRLREVLAAQGRRIRLVPYRRTASGEVDVDDVRARIGARTRVVVVTHVHGVFGARSTLEEVHDVLSPEVVIVVDASQSVGHIPVDVEALRADFLFFSAHKMFGLPGTGVLYCRRRTHDRIGPFLPGGGASQTAATDLDDALLPTGPAALETGTVNVPGIAALGAAVQFVDEVGCAAIAAHTADLTRRLVEGLRALPRVRLLPGVAHGSCRVGYGIVSFTVDGERSDDVGFALAEHGIDVRAGRHCLATRGGLTESVRASVHLYSTQGDVERLVSTMGDLVRGRSSDG